MKTVSLPKNVIRETDPHELVALLKRTIDAGVDRIEFFESEPVPPPKAVPRWLTQPD